MILASGNSALHALQHAHGVRGDAVVVAEQDRGLFGERADDGDALELSSAAARRRS